MTPEQIEAAVKRVDRALLIAWALAGGIAPALPTDKKQVEDARADMAAIRLHLKENA